MNILIYSLLLRNIFTYVDGNREYNDHALDYILEIGVDLEIIQAVVDYLKSYNSDKDASDSSDTAAEGYAADNTSADSVGIIVKTC